MGPEDEKEHDDDYLAEKDFSEEYNDGRTRLDGLQGLLEKLTGSI